MKHRTRRAGIDLLLFAIMTGGLFVAGAAVPVAPPEVSVSVNDSQTPEVFRGMPLLVTVTLVHPLALDTNAVPILIAGASGPWTNSLQLDVTDESGATISWPFHSSGTPSNTVMLNSTQYVQMHRWLTPAETLALSTGRFFVTATLNTTNVTLPGVWNGIVESMPAEVILVNEPLLLSEEQAENKYSQLALYELFLNGFPAALMQINEFLTLFPTNISAMRISALALDRVGRTAEAYAECERALAEVNARYPNRPEPPINLLELQRQLEAKLNPPVLAVIAANQQLSVSWFGHADLRYRLESSSDLINWSLVTTNFATVGNTLSSSIPLSPGRRFLRVAR